MESQVSLKMPSSFERLISKSNAVELCDNAALDNDCTVEVEYDIIILQYTVRNPKSMHPTIHLETNITKDYFMRHSDSADSGIFQKSIFFVLAIPEVWYINPSEVMGSLSNLKLYQEYSILNTPESHLHTSIKEINLFTTDELYDGESVVCVYPQGTETTSDTYAIGVEVIFILEKETQKCGDDIDSNSTVEEVKNLWSIGFDLPLHMRYISVCDDGSNSTGTSVDYPKIPYEYFVESPVILTPNIYLPCAGFTRTTENIRSGAGKNGFDIHHIYDFTHMGHAGNSASHTYPIRYSQYANAQYDIAETKLMLPILLPYHSSHRWSNQLLTLGCGFYVLWHLFKWLPSGESKSKKE